MSGARARSLTDAVLTNPCNKKQETQTVVECFSAAFLPFAIKRGNWGWEELDKEVRGGRPKHQVPLQWLALLVGSVPLLSQPLIIRHRSVCFAQKSYAKMLPTSIPCFQVAQSCRGKDKKKNVQQTFPIPRRKREKRGKRVAMRIWSPETFVGSSGKWKEEDREEDLVHIFWPGNGKSSPNNLQCCS